MVVLAKYNTDLEFPKVLILFKTSGRARTFFVGGGGREADDF